LVYYTDSKVKLNVAKFPPETFINAAKLHQNALLPQIFEKFSGEGQNPSFGAQLTPSMGREITLLTNPLVAFGHSVCPAGPM